MRTTSTSFPKPGAELPYGEAIEAYDAIERRALAKVYSEGFLPCTSMHDLIEDVVGIAAKHGIDDERDVVDFRNVARWFVFDRTSLANGHDGERFRLMGSPERLAEFDRERTFTAGVDGEELLEKLDRALGTIRKEAPRFDEYADVFSPEPTIACRGARRPLPEKEPWQDTWFARVMATSACCIAVACAAHAIGQVTLLAHLFQ